MGLGGDLLWTPVLRALHERNGAPVLLCDRPRLSDLLAGTAHDRGSGRGGSPVFAGNPFVRFPACCPKGAMSRWLDRSAEALLGFNRGLRWLENGCYQRARKAGFRTLYLDLPQHSYAVAGPDCRYTWKQGGHVIDILAASVDLTPVPHQCELFFEAEEARRGREMATAFGARGYLAIEPSTNKEFFGELRSWPFERWQQVVDWLREKHPGLPVVQLGMPGARALSGCSNLCGKTTFREAALVIRHSRLFMGTDGGLMHCANAVKARAIILWGGLTDPSFLSYPDVHTVLHHPVPCAPCGLQGHCPHGRACMLSITVAEVVAALETELLRPAAAPRGGA